MTTENTKRLARQDAGHCRREAKRGGIPYVEGLRWTAESHRHTATRYRALDPCLERDAANLEALADELDRMADRAKS